MRIRFRLLVCFLGLGGRTCWWLCADAWRLAVLVLDLVVCRLFGFQASLFQVGVRLGFVLAG